MKILLLYKEYIIGIVIFLLLLYPVVRIIARAWYRSYIEEITNMKNEGEKE